MSGLRAQLQRGWPWVIFVTTIIVFLPVLDCEFLNWDDQTNFVQNYHYKGWTAEHLRWILTSFHLGVWQPLSWLLLDIEWTLWGLDPSAHHLVSLLLHGLNAVLVYFAGLRLLGLGFGFQGSMFGFFAPRFSAFILHPSSFNLSLSAAFGALFYALHPLRTETVAWLSCQPYLLATAFALLSILAHFKSVLSPQSSVLSPSKCAALGFYALALMSKGMVITLPVVLVILDFYPLRRLSFRIRDWLRPEFRTVLLEKIPFFALAAIAAWLAVVGKAHGMRGWTEHGLIQRVAQMGFGAAFYIWKTALPIALSPLYPLPGHLDPFEARFVLSTVFVLAITVILFLRYRKWPGALTAWMTFGVLVSPVLGLAQAGPQIAADRYTYLPGLVWGIFTGGALMRLSSSLPMARLSPVTRHLSLVISAVMVTTVILIFAFLSWSGIRTWKSSETVWRRALDIGPPNVTAYNNLGHILLEEGRLKESVEQFKKLLQLEPGHAEAYNNLGLAYAGLGQKERAINCYQEAIRSNRGYASAYNNLANLLVDQKRMEEAIPIFRQAIALQRDNPETYCNLGLALMSQSQWREALNVLQVALKIDAQNPNALYSLAWLKATSPDAMFRNGGEAWVLATKLCALTHDENPQSFDALAAAWAELGKFEEAQQAAIRGLEWATRLKQPKLSDKIRQHLELYRKHQPCRSP